MAGFELTRASSSARWATARIDGTSGQAGLGFYVLNFHLTLGTVATDQTAQGSYEQLIQLWAELRVGTHLLGYATARAGLPIRQIQYANDVNLVLSMDFDRARLEAIETVRAGNDLQLSLNIYAYSTDQDGNGQWRTSTASYTINQSAWAQVLEQMSYRKTLLLEIPVPDERATPELSAAVRDLSSAQRAMERGDYREAVGQCREVMEQLGLALKDNDSVGFENQTQKTKADRLRLLRRSLKVFTHPAHHRDEVTVTIEWGRVDAVCAISIAAALINELSAPDAR